MSHLELVTGSGHGPLGVQLSLETSLGLSQPAGWAGRPSWTHGPHLGCSKPVPLASARWLMCRGPRPLDFTPAFCPHLWVSSQLESLPTPALTLVGLQDVSPQIKSR